MPGSPEHDAWLKGPEAYAAWQEAQKKTVKKLAKKPTKKVRAK